MIDVIQGVTIILFVIIAVIILRSIGQGYRESRRRDDGQE